MKIVLEEYNPKWNNAFISIRKEVQSIISIPCKVEHIGSTAVNGLVAKPIIDVMVGLEDFSNVDYQISQFEKAGYKYISQFENEIPERKLFFQFKRNIKVSHIHVVEYDSEFWKRHILVRDCLRNNKEIKDRYAQLKLKLSRQEWEESNDYSNAKNEFIRKIEKRFV